MAFEMISIKILKIGKFVNTDIFFEICVGT